MLCSIEEIEDHLNAFITIEKLTNDSRVFETYIADKTRIHLYRNSNTIIGIDIYDDYINIQLNCQESFHKNNNSICAVDSRQIIKLLKEKKINYKDERPYYSNISITCNNYEKFKTIFNIISNYLYRTIYRK